MFPLNSGPRWGHLSGQYEVTAGLKTAVVMHSSVYGNKKNNILFKVFSCNKNVDLETLNNNLKIKYNTSLNVKRSYSLILILTYMTGWNRLLSTLTNWLNIPYHEHCRDIGCNFERIQVLLASRLDTMVFRQRIERIGFWRVLSMVCIRSFRQLFHCKDNLDIQHLWRYVVLLGIAGSPRQKPLKQN